MTTASREAVVSWLLRGDPSIRWQAMRDLLARPRREWEREQARVARPGWGARLIAHQAFTRFSFPPRWHHDVLRTLDYFRASNAAYDERLDDPVRLVTEKRGSDGRWVLQNRHPGRTFFEMEPAGKPSRWNTLRALRVLDWYERSRKAAIRRRQKA